MRTLTENFKAIFNADYAFIQKAIPMLGLFGIAGHLSFPVILTLAFGYWESWWLRGPAALLYGSSAVGGVVNVISDDIPTTVPARLADLISKKISIPTIGIGAGGATDAQVLVINDILGLTEQPPKFSKNFLAETGDIKGALLRYTQDVKTGKFPADIHIFE